MKLLLITLVAVSLLYAQPVEARRSFRCRHGQVTLRFPSSKYYGCVRRQQRPTQYKFSGRWRRVRSIIPVVRNRNRAHIAKRYPRTYRSKKRPRVN